MAYYTQLGRCINPHDGRAIQLFDPAGSDSELPAFFSEQFLVAEACNHPNCLVLLPF